MQQARLTEVLRGTTRLLAGGAAFGPASNVEPEVQFMGGDPGPPLKTYIFEGESFPAYAVHVLKALDFVQKTCRFRRQHGVAVLTRDEVFSMTLRPALDRILRRSHRHRRVRLVSVAESFWQGWSEECLILDSVEKAAGREFLAVILVGLDCPVSDTAVDIERQSLLYKAITRAQFMAVIVNHLLEGGWLEPLSKAHISASGA